MPKLRKELTVTDGRTDSNYRKASLLKLPLLNGGWKPSELQCLEVHGLHNMITSAPTRYYYLISHEDTGMTKSDII